MHLEKLSLIEIRDLIAGKKVSSEEAVKFFIRQCEDMADLKAVVEMFYAAGARAKACD